MRQVLYQQNLGYIYGTCQPFTGVEGKWEHDNWYSYSIDGEMTMKSFKFH